jgi:hypothetical protein
VRADESGSTGDERGALGALGRFSHAGDCKRVNRRDLGSASPGQLR